MNTLMRTILVRLEAWPLSARLLLGIGNGLVLALFMGLIGIYAVRSLNDSTQQAYDIDLAAVAHLHEAQTHNLKVGLYLRQMSITSAETLRMATRKALDAASSGTRSSMQALREHLAGVHAQQLPVDFDTPYAAFAGQLEKALELLARQDSYSDGEAISLITSDEFKKVSDAVSAALAEMARLKTADMAASLARNRALAARTELWLWIIFLLSLAGGLAGGLLITRSIRSPLNDLRHSIEEIAGGVTDGVIPHVGQDNEIGAIAQSLQLLQQSAKAQDEQRWVKANMVALAAALQGIDSISVLARQLMARVTPLIGAQVGVFYYLDRKEQCFNLVGSYGYQMRKDLKAHFRLGEGIVGQCAAERAAILLSEVPQGYLHIATALGHAQPRFALAAPVIGNGGEVLAVLEVGLLQYPGVRERALFDEVLPLVGTTISILEGQQRAQQEREH